MAEIAWGPFLERHTYNRRRDIHAIYGGQQQGGICTPTEHPVIFLFTGEAGGQHGYSDGWKVPAVTDSIARLPTKRPFSKRFLPV